ncbi:MAG: hypothetical protein A2W69_03610 [Gammaproteobacteria bacterium RIFCSPLOWO2_02_47_7]|jgi:hypothetical protein|nr:MAG: hypothetical protein A2W69_03610 [Gammaproteobacteria bacterium RIFCSPLOWO2_02_47_7]OGT75732.1 MAG: hypothetical protein A2W76_07720 [Gammaproteobacteria bacterium RIFCSPLOWO2_12_47_11]
MKSVVFTVNSETNQNLSANHMTSEQTSNTVQYSELPGALMLGVDGKLKPLYHGPDAEIKMPR